MKIIIKRKRREEGRIDFNDCAAPVSRGEPKGFEFNTTYQTEEGKSLYLEGTIYTCGLSTCGPPCAYAEIAFEGVAIYSGKRYEYVRIEGSVYPTSIYPDIFLHQVSNVVTMLEHCKRDEDGWLNLTSKKIK